MTNVKLLARDRLFFNHGVYTSYYCTRFAITACKHCFVSFIPIITSQKQLASPVLCVMQSIAIALLSWGFAGFKFHISLVSLLLGYLNAAVLYTVDNGGVMMLSALYSITLFKEKATPLKIIGIIIVVISLCVLGFNSI